MSGKAADQAAFARQKSRPVLICRNLPSRKSDVLDHDITIAGPIIANLYVSSTGTDADFIVKLIDVFPGDAPRNRNDMNMGDFQMLVGGDVFRAKYRKSFEHPEPLLPGERYR